MAEPASVLVCILGLDARGNFSFVFDIMGWAKRHLTVGLGNIIGRIIGYVFDSEGKHTNGIAS